jgi:ribosomal protein S14
MVCKIKKDLKLRKKVIKIFFNKQLLKSFIKNPKISIEERQYLKYKFNFKYKASISKLRNHCIISQNTHSIYKYVKLSRHLFKKMVLNGNLPG